jgi:hypothetical protein
MGIFSIFSSDCRSIFSSSMKPTEATTISTRSSHAASAGGAYVAFPGPKPGSAVAEKGAGGTMRPPRIELGKARAQLGRWEARSRRIVLSTVHIEQHPWVDVLATLRHEMAHQFADEVLHARGEPPHGPAFQYACRRLRCLDEHRDAGSNGPEEGEDHILSRIRKVLSLTASPNRHEAAAAVKQARRLLLSHNLDETCLERRRDFTYRHLGPVKVRHAAYEKWLAQILHEFFFTEVIWVESYRPLEDRDGTVLQVCGSPRNLEMATYVYTYLTELVKRLWERYRRRSGLETNRERQRFYAGVLEGFCARLRDQEQRFQAEEGLVWRGDGRLVEFYHYLHPHAQVRRGGGVTVNGVYLDGVAAGKRVVIHRPVPGGVVGFGGYLSGA